MPPTEVTACMYYFLFFFQPSVLGLPPQSPAYCIVRKSACSGRSALVFCSSCLYCHATLVPTPVLPTERSSRAADIRPGHSDMDRGSFATPLPRYRLSDRARRLFFMRQLQWGRWRHCSIRAGGQVSYDCVFFFPTIARLNPSFSLLGRCQEHKSGNQRRQWRAAREGGAWQQPHFPVRV